MGGGGGGDQVGGIQRGQQRGEQMTGNRKGRATKADRIGDSKREAAGDNTEPLERELRLNPKRQTKEKNRCY